MVDSEVPSIPFRWSTPVIREGVELITGLDDTPLLFDSTTGIYHRISDSGEKIVRLMDGQSTVEELTLLIARGDPNKVDGVCAQLSGFLDSLGDSGLLDGTEPPARQKTHSRFSASRLMPRVVVTRSLPKLLEPIAALLRRRALSWLGVLAVMASVIGFGFGIVEATQLSSLDGHQVGWAIVIATALQLVGVLIHECSHALVAQIQRTPIRGLGFAMLLYFMPVAYVDRTDAYRLRGRGGRIAIAMAGMVTDGWLCGVTSLALASTTGTVHHVMAVLLTFQLMGLFINLNPLLPTDGYTIIEIITGIVDLRGRAFAFLRCALTGKAKPGYLKNVSTVSRLGYLSYGIASTAYICLAIFATISGTIAMTQNAISGAH